MNGAGIKGGEQRGEQGGGGVNRGEQKGGEQRGE